MENMKKRKPSGNEFRQEKSKRLMAESAKNTVSIFKFLKSTNCLQESCNSESNETQSKNQKREDVPESSFVPEINFVQQESAREEGITAVNYNVPLSEEPPIAEVSSLTSHSVTKSHVSSSNVKTADIGLFTSKVLIDEATKKQLIEEGFWKPNDVYAFPKCPKNNRRFQYSWFSRFNWLEYSELKKGAFCKYCVLFAPESAGAQKIRLQSLISEPYTKYKNAIEDFTKHANTIYHKNSVENSCHFISCVQGKTLHITDQIDKHRRNEIEKNRAILTSVIKTVIFCGRQELALRGHRDSGSVEDISEANDGNFREALRFRMDSGDNILKNHLHTASVNATYISWSTQNSIIEEIGQYITEGIVKEIAEVKYFSILVDETTDCSTQEQMSITIRYILNGKLLENFLAFVSISDCTATNIAKVILETLDAKGINKLHMRGQGYDGCATMSGHINGVQALIKKECPSAIFTHCSSHVLNLVVNYASNVVAIKNALGTVGEICSFFKASAKRLTLLQDCINETCPTSSHSRLKSLCATRWVQRHEAVIIFLELFSAVLLAFEKMSAEEKSDNAAKATSFLSSVCNGQFVIALLCMHRVSSLLLPVSRLLQLKNLELIQAVELVKDTKECFIDIRKNAEKNFSSIFEKALHLGKEHDFEIEIPRLAKRRRNRENYPAETAENYYRRSLFVPYLDQMISELEQRFGDSMATVAKLQYFIPSFCIDASFADISDAVKMYSDDLCNNESVVEGEFELWKKKWGKLSECQRPNTALETLATVKEIFVFFPNIATVLNIFGVLPVTTATAERTFSTLRRLKSYMRSTMSENRLSGLALMSIHRNRTIDIEYIINKLALRKNRRLNFVL